MIRNSMTLLLYVSDVQYRIAVLAGTIVRTKFRRKEWLFLAWYSGGVRSKMDYCPATEGSGQWYAIFEFQTNYSFVIVRGISTSEQGFPSILSSS